MSLDLESHLVFYGAYHHDTVNKFVHILCVPMILATGFCMATYTGPLVTLPAWLTSSYFEPNLGTIVAMVYAGLYILLEPVAGSILAILCMAAATASTYLYTHNPSSTWPVAVGLHIFGWIAQFIGHGVYEGRAPALLDNLVQAIFLAPMFVWLELLFMLGYRPELRDRVEKEVQVEIAKFRNEAAKKNR